MVSRCFKAFHGDSWAFRGDTRGFQVASGALRKTLGGSFKKGFKAFQCIPVCFGDLKRIKGKFTKVPKRLRMGFQNVSE